MKHVPATFGVFLLAAAVSASVHAQQAATAANKEKQDSSEAVDLDSVIVTGTRSPKAVDKIAGAITLVTKEEIALFERDHMLSATSKTKINFSNHFLLKVFMKKFNKLLLM